MSGLPGRTIRIMGRSVFDFSSVKGSTTQQLVIARRIDVRGYREATFLVRCMSGSSMSGLTALQFYVFADWSTDEDPTMTSGGGVLPGYWAAIGSPTDLHSMSVGDLKVIPVVPSSGGFGPRLGIALQATQPATPASGIFWTSIDCDMKS